MPANSGMFSGCMMRSRRGLGLGDGGVGVLVRCLGIRSGYEGSTT